MPENPCPAVRAVIEHQQRLYDSEQQIRLTITMDTFLKKAGYFMADEEGWVPLEVAMAGVRRMGITNTDENKVMGTLICKGRY